MAEEMDRPLMKRFEELACRADRQGVWTDTEFLTLAEQAVLLRMRLPVPVSLHGGYPDAERRLAAFGSEALFGFSYAPPIVCVRMAPAAERFADALTHRDFLGALMGLGVRREVMGDIRVEGSTGYLFCLRAIAPYLIDSLHEVKRTVIRCSAVPPPETLTQPPALSTLVVSSERLDALVAAAYRLSRGAGKTLVEQGRVSLNGRPTQNAGQTVPPGCIVSVRGMGRFCYEGLDRETKKGRLRVRVRLY